MNQTITKIGNERKLFASAHFRQRANRRLGWNRLNGGSHPDFNFPLFKVSYV